MKIKAKVISNVTEFISKKTGSKLYKFYVMTEHNDVCLVISQTAPVASNIEIEFVPRVLFYK